MTDEQLSEIESRCNAATPGPWDGEWWKPSTRERDLEKAGALLAAALDLRMRPAEEE